MGKSRFLRLVFRGYVQWWFLSVNYHDFLLIYQKMYQVFDQPKTAPLRKWKDANRGCIVLCGMKSNMSMVVYVWFRWETKWCWKQMQFDTHTPGVIRLPIWEGIKQCKCMVVLRKFPQRSALFGLVMIEWPLYTHTHKSKQGCIERFRNFLWLVQKGRIHHSLLYLIGRG